MSRPSGNDRVILLLDLDCFYAQCERVRIGLPSDASVALLQWDSVLAVTYPARGFGIKRGDSWEAVREKSHGKCLALHLPLLTTRTDVHEKNVETSIEQAYQQRYCLAEEERQRILDTEAGVQRFPQEGKACLERYRVASSRIFSVVLEALTAKVGKGKFVLERASIDELFLDVTTYCWEQPSEEESSRSTRILRDETVVVGDDHQGASYEDGPYEDVDYERALTKGCSVAKDIRNELYQRLGFTMSAGISTCKLVAKLGASYGKPDGQAVIFPRAVDHVMNKTQIRKVRHFGGKIGKQVQSLLPPEEDTMGSIARLLSLPVLCNELGSETGRKVFDASRGIDSEPVKETIGALVKSITAFKSFPRTVLHSAEMSKWILLLSSDVISRVEQDSTRNNRFPKTLSIQYICSRPGHEERITRSVRVAFPRKNAPDDEQKLNLVERVRGAIQGKEGSVTMHRVGLCATDFEVRLREGGISSFFPKSVSPLSAVKEKGTKVEPEKKASRSSFSQEPVTKSCTRPTLSVDEEFARDLQKQYDREDQVLGCLEKRKTTKPHKIGSTQNGKKKKMRIDSFFRKSK